MNLASFDIFDTVLIRKCGKPENVFPLIAESLFPEDTAMQQEYVQWRVYRNEVMARTNPNYILEDIYDTDAIDSFRPYTRQQLIDREERKEQEMLTCNPTTMKIVESYRKQGYTIAFISDMYLREDFIKEILVQEGILQDGDYLYVSSSKGHRKDDGTLYDYVREQLHPSNWEHFGDNKQSDYFMAKKKGIKAHNLVADYTPLEKQMIKDSHLFRSYNSLSLLAGLLRTARYKQDNTAEANLTIDFLAAEYIPYVYNCLRDASMRGIKRLYFLSRDSFILEEIAKHIPHEGIDFYYLFVSRASLFLPYLYKADRSKIKSIIFNNMENVDYFLRHLGLSHDILSQYGLDVEFKFADTDSRKEKLLDAIMDERIYTVWQEEAKVQYENCCGYFREQGLFDNEKMALVDVGWVGSTRMMINDIRDRQEHNDSDIFSYYWYLQKDVLPGKYGHYSAFMKDMSLSSSMVALFERFYSMCPYATTICYKHDENGYGPVFKGNVAPKIKAGALYHADVVCQLTESMKQYYFENDVLYYWSILAYEQLRYLRQDVDLSLLKGEIQDGMEVLGKMSVKDYIQCIWGKGYKYYSPDFCLMHNIGSRKAKTVLKIREKVFHTKERIKRLIGWKI